MQSPPDSPTTSIAQPETERRIVQLAPANIQALWSQIAPIIKPAVDQVSTHQVHDIYRSVMSMRSQMWVELVGTDVLTAVVTEFVDYPAGLYLRIWLCAAKSDARMDNNLWLEEMDRYRDASGAVGFEAIGRPGWLKRFPLKVEGLVMRWAP
jgi:hypothetical protein